ncbi:MAG: IS1 family transposase [Chloroflexota bacterium]
MIQETTTFTCRTCGSANTIRNGTNKCGNPQYHCKDCGVYRVMKPRERHSSMTKQCVLRAALERVSLRGIERIFGVCRQTVADWIREQVWQLPVLADTLIDYEVGDVLEMDELWSFVGNKEQKRWIWIALCRRTRQIVAFYIGKRDEGAAQQLWQRLEYPYTLCPMYTDHYRAYHGVLPEHLHWAKDKQSGATAHIERWNNTLRQRLARFVRKTLSFSKSDVMHRIMLEWFIIHYNQQVASLTT